MASQVGALYRQASRGVEGEVPGLASGIVAEVKSLS